MMHFLFALIAVIIIRVVFGAQLLTSCPREQVKFEKIIGLRPSPHVDGYPLHKQQNRETVTAECLAKCLSKNECVSFVLYYNVSECYWYNVRFDGLEERQNVIDSDVGWFEKTCLHVQSCDKLWIFERIPGSILVGSGVRTLPNKMTRQDCQQQCLDEAPTICRAINFRIFDEPNATETLGTCTLSDSDRHLVANAYRVSSYNEEYFENQCSNATTNEFCAYEEYESVILSHVDMKYDDKSKDECEGICETLSLFNCRGYSVVPVDDIQKIDNNLCLIHSEDSKIHGPRSLHAIQGARYYEKARCLNITVSCTNTYITINYLPEINFKGKLYMTGYSEHLECYVLGHGKQMITLKMPLIGNQCGIREAKTTNHINRTLLSGTMVLQYNSLIQTQGDRLIRVGCIFTNESRVVLGTGINFTNSSYPSRGTTIVNSSTVQPIVEMRIVDFYTQKHVAETQIGQELQLIIEIKPGQGPYDIWAGHLVAMTDTAQDSILLLDDRGCPTNLNIFPSLLKVVSSETRKLTGNFQAFKFASSPIVRFSVIVQFCTIHCPPIDCDNNIISNGRKRRAIIEDTNVTQLNKQQFDSQGTNITMMPLEFVLIVKNTKITPDKLVYGENNKILVAGYDLVTNEVCVDYSLLVGIIIVWVVTQIILVTCSLLMIKRYKRHYQEENRTQSLEELHKNFGLGFSNLETRRVHWADNSSFH